MIFDFDVQRLMKILNQFCVSVTFAENGVTFTFDVKEHLLCSYRRGKVCICL